MRTPGKQHGLAATGLPAFVSLSMAGSVGRRDDKAPAGNG